MATAFIIAFFSLMGLLVLHELGHFIIAKRFGVKVEEFGIGYPPRLFGKKIGETLYSVNLLPFGAFVSMPGETGKAAGPRSFSSQAVWKRMLIALGGVVSFWVMAAVIFSVIFSMGTHVAVSDDEANVENPKVQILAVSLDSPAKLAGLSPGDTIKGAKNQESEAWMEIVKVSEIQNFTNISKGEEVVLTIQRGKEVFDVSLIPRVSPPAGEGAMGVSLVRTALKSYPWYESPWQGAKASFNMTVMIIQGYKEAISNQISGKPTGIELMGPVGTFNLLAQAGQLGASSFLQFIGMIAVYIAIFNILPIPALDGGKMVFLGIEAVRRKPVSEKTEQRVTAFCFALLFILMILVTIKDISKFKLF